MTRVYLAVSLDTERTALHFLLMELGLEVIGEAADWSTTLTQAPIRQADMLLVDWNLLPDPANLALENARAACPSALIIVLVSHQDAGRQAALSPCVDAFISKGETLNRLVEGLRAAVRLAPDR